MLPQHPVGMVEPGALTSVPISLHVTSGVVGVPSLTPAQRLRDATALIFGNVIDDSLLLLQPCVDLCESFAQACGCNAEVGKAGVMRT